MQDRGSASVEYTLLVLFIAIAALAAIAVFGGMVLGLFEAGADSAIWSTDP